MGKQGPPFALVYRRLLISFLLIIMAGVANPLNASTPSCSLTVLPNNGTISANARAPNTNFKWGRAVYLVTATELAASGFAAGSIPTAIGWNYQTSGELGATPLIIYFENTTDTINTKNISWATAITGMTVVHNAMTHFRARPVRSILLSPADLRLLIPAAVCISRSTGANTPARFPLERRSCAPRVCPGVLSGHKAMARPRSIWSRAIFVRRHG